MKKVKILQLSAALLVAYLVPGQILPRLTPPPPDVSVAPTRAFVDPQESINVLNQIQRPMPVWTQGAATR